MGPTSVNLVLLPGLYGTGELFADFIDALPVGFEATPVRYPADRYSYASLAPVVTAAIPTSTPFILVAESFSTPLAIQIAATRPPYLKGLVLCAGFASSPARGLSRLAALFLSPILTRLPLGNWVANRALLGSDAPPALVAAVQRATSTTNPAVLYARMRAVLDCDVLTDLAAISVPVFYVQASQDRLVGSRSLQEILERTPRIQVAAIYGPHLLMQREPTLTAEAVANFAREIA
jgi:pimeloyl-[acyl-carrier protein] methyl ester esterase